MKIFYLIIIAINLVCLTSSAQVEDGRYGEEEVAFQDKFIEAKGYILLDRADKAEEILVNLYKERRDNAAIALELSYLYHDLNNLEKEYKFAKLAAENSADNEHIVEHFGDISFDQQRYEDAITSYSKLVRFFPTSEKYTDKLATAFLRNDNPEAAIKAYDALEQRNGISENVSRRKIEIYSNLKKEDKAVSELQKLVAAQPSNLAALHVLASKLSSINKQKQAEDIYAKILTIDINDTKANIALMGSEGQPLNDENYLRALSPIIENNSISIDNKVLELIPYTEKLANNSDEKLRSALLEVTQRLTAIHPTEAKAHALLGDVNYLSGNINDAIKSYERTLELNDKVYSVWDQLLSAYNFQKNYTKLHQVGEEAVDLFPNQVMAFYYFGKACRLTGKTEDAIEYLSEGYMVSGKDLHAKSDVLVELGLSLSANGEETKGEKKIDQALELSNNQNPAALHAKGEILTSRGDDKEAKKYFDLAKKYGGVVGENKRS